MTHLFRKSLLLIILGLGLTAIAGLAFVARSQAAGGNDRALVVSPAVESVSAAAVKNGPSGGDTAPSAGTDVGNSAGATGASAASSATAARVTAGSEAGVAVADTGSGVARAATPAGAAPGALATTATRAGSSASSSGPAGSGSAAMTNKFELTGIVLAIGDAGWTIGGQLVAITAATEIDSSLVVGDEAKAEGTIADDGALVAREIKRLAGDDDDYPLNVFELTGSVDAIGDDSWTISGQVVAITALTEIDPGIVVGDRVKAEGTIADDGALVAREIKRVHGDDDDDGDDDHDEFEFVGIVEVIGDESWTVGGQTVAVTLMTEIEAGIMVGDEVKVEGTYADDGTRVAHEIELHDSDDDEMDEVEFVGTVESMGADSWIISGQTVNITAQTEIDDGIMIGDEVKVEARVATDGALIAWEIELLDDDDDDDENDSGSGGADDNDGGNGGGDDSGGDDPGDHDDGDHDDGDHDDDDDGDRDDDDDDDDDDDGDD